MEDNEIRDQLMELLSPDSKCAGLATMHMDNLDIDLPPIVAYLLVRTNRNFAIVFDSDILRVNFSSRVAKALKKLVHSGIADVVSTRICMVKGNNVSFHDFFGNAIEFGDGEFVICIGKYVHLPSLRAKSGVVFQE